MKKLSYKQKTMKLTGWSSERYDKEYRTFSKRVRNLNRTQDLQIKASQQLYLRERYQGNLSPLQKQIAATPATQATRAISDIEKTYYLPQSNQYVVMPSDAELHRVAKELRERWAGAIEKNDTVKEIVSRMVETRAEIMAGGQSPAHTESLLEIWSNFVHMKNDDGSKAVYGSDDKNA